MENLNITLWKNEHKSKETHPDFTATIKVGDKFEDVGGAWKKVSPKSGKTFLSMSLKTEVIKQAIASMGQPKPSDEF